MSVLDYIVHYLGQIWDILSFVHPFQGNEYTTFLGRHSFGVSMFSLLVAFSVIEMILDYFNGHPDEEEEHTTDFH